MTGKVPKKPPDPKFKEVKKTTVVKCCLRSVLNNKLSQEQKETFLYLVDQYTEIISKLMRRGTLFMLHHVARIFEDGLQIPDFKSQKTTYWKNVLKIGCSILKFR
jgi:hypothetical protein